jgi:hypothetical protein
MARGSRLATLLASLLFATTAFAALSRGPEEFQLGGSPTDLQDRFALRQLEVVSTGVNRVSVTSDDPRVDYETYEFFPGPHGAVSLWRVTIAYRMPYSAEWMADAEGELAEELGPPDRSSVTPRDSFDQNPFRLFVWHDDLTQVQLGGRANGAGADDATDRMIVTWTDRKLQRQIDAKRRQERKRR